MDITILLTWAPALILMLVVLLMLLTTAHLGRRLRQVTETRYDYKVVDIMILQDPDNHEEQIQKWADEGWRIVACIPLTGGAVEGAPEVRYVICRPWESRRLEKTIRVQAKEKRKAVREERRLKRVAEKPEIEPESTKPRRSPVGVPALALEKNLDDRLTPEEG
jgi:hypothetical protein